MVSWSEYRIGSKELFGAVISAVSLIFIFGFG